MPSFLKAKGEVQTLPDFGGDCIFPPPGENDITEYLCNLKNVQTVR